MVGLLTPCSVLRGGFLCAMIVLGDGFCSLQAVSGGFAPGERMFMDKIDTCLTISYDITARLKACVICFNSCNSAITEDSVLEVYLPVLGCHEKKITNCAGGMTMTQRP